MLEDHVRKLMPLVRKTLGEIVMWHGFNIAEEQKQQQFEEAIKALEIVKEIMPLLGYLEDKIQPGTTCKNYKLFEDE